MYKVLVKTAELSRCINSWSNPIRKQERLIFAGIATMKEKLL